MTSLRGVGAHLADLLGFAVIVVGVSAAAGAQTNPLPDRLLQVVRNNAPAIIAEVDPRTFIDLWECSNQNYYHLQDHMMAVDFDGDILGSNNYDAVCNSPSRITNRRPTVYFSIEETGTSDSDGFYYINYYFYHPFDGGQTLDGYNFPGHDHDLEGIALIVRKSPYAPYGQPILALTEAHGALIPYWMLGQVDPTAMQSDADGYGSWGGMIEQWYDFDFARYRPIVAVRTSTHGTYMAQECAWRATDPYSYYDGFGAIVPNSSSEVTACIHSEENWTYLLPALNNAYVADMPDNTSSGTYEYQLVHDATGPMWGYKATAGGLFSGTRYDLGYGMTAFDSFNPSGANPAWAWSGGPGESNGIPGNNGYWYSFAIDNTTTVHHEAGQWPTIFYGDLLMKPHMVAWRYFDRYSDASGDATARFANLPVMYNAYHAVTPPPPPNAPSVSIDGPTSVEAGMTDTYVADVSGGTAPYTYQWSGLVRGTGASASGKISLDGDVVLTVTDAAGAIVTVSVHVTVECQDGNMC